MSAPPRLLAIPRSLAYLAPEQLDGSAIGGYTDVHAVGLIMCELLTGETPWPRVDSLGALVRQRASDLPRPVAELGPHLPESLIDLLDRVTSAEPVRRPGSARSFADQLDGVMKDAFGPDWLGSQPFVVAVDG